MPRLSTLLDLRATDPFRTPDWRWQLAEELSRTWARCPRTLGEPFRTLFGYVRMLRHDHDRQVAQAARRWPDLDAARRLFDAGGPPRWELEARLLAGQSDQEIAAACGLSVAVVNWYEQALFQVRDRLHARDWVAFRLLGPGLRRGFSRGDLEGLWKAMAYHGGPAVLDLVLSVTLDRPLPVVLLPDRAADRAERDARLRLGTRLLVEALTDVPAVPWATMVRLQEKVSGRREDSARLRLHARWLDVVHHSSRGPDEPDGKAPRRTGARPRSQAAPEPVGLPLPTQ